MTIERFIPANAKSVIELTGEVSEEFETSKKFFLEIQPECNYKIAVDDSELEGTFDAILIDSSLIGKLYGKNLIALIKKCSEHLSETGTIIFTLDNITNGDNITALLNGNPPIFKVTLTIEELAEAIEESGLILLRTRNAQRPTTISKKLTEITNKNLAVFMYIITATKIEPPAKTLIQTVIGEDVACAPTRVHLPNDFLATERNVFTRTSLHGKPYELFDREQYGNRILINQRVLFSSFASGLNFLDIINKKEILFVSEFDDNPILWQDDFTKTAWINFRGAHAIQTSTPYLADYFRQYNPHVMVFENQLRRLPPQRNFDDEFQKKKPVTIFFGALNRDGDFLELLPLLNDLAKKYKNKVFFKILARKNLFDALKTDNKAFVGDLDKYDGQFINYNDYEAEIHSSDIALLPLRDNEFNRAKSDLKFIECAAHGTAVLASDVVYGKTIRDGITGFIYRNEKEFVDKFNLLVTNRDLRRTIAENAYDYVKTNRLMSQHYQERLEWYRELLLQLPELAAESMKRLEPFIPQFQQEIDKFRARLSQNQNSNEPIRI